jgi:CsoR family transcriptional regulator, copper-sensing transcriptional repressor
MTPQKIKALKLSKSANSTLLKVQKMIEADEYCPTIIQQLNSVSGLLETVKKELLSGHLHHCFDKRLAENKEKTIDEILQIFSLKK